jgi:hypothetical protein
VRADITAQWCSSVSVFVTPKFSFVLSEPRVCKGADLPLGVKSTPGMLHSTAGTHHVFVQRVTLGI